MPKEGSGHTQKLPLPRAKIPAALPNIGIQPSVHGANGRRHTRLPQRLPDFCVPARRAKRVQIVPHLF